MTIGIQLGSIIDEVGTPAFLHAFFSTISGNLEPQGWGSRFPALLSKLYSGRLDASDATKARAELRIITDELTRLPPDRVIWDVEDRSARPLWGDNIAPDITSLANYFVTSTGRDLIQLLDEVLEEQERSGGTAEVVTY